MEIRITLGKKHIYTLLTILSIVLASILVSAFGGNNPVLLGHSGGEIDVTGLSGTAASLNIGGNAATATSAGFATSASTATQSSTCGDSSNACRFGAGTGNGGDASCTSNPPRLGSDSCYVNVYAQNGLAIGSPFSTGTVIAADGTLRVRSGNSGGNQVSRCITAATSEGIGVLTVAPSFTCVTSAATGLYVN